MRLKPFILQNFRGAADVSLQFNTRANVLLGANGAGKSTILDALSVLLSKMVARLRAQGQGHKINENDIRNGLNQVSIASGAIIFGSNVSWGLSKLRQGIRRQSKNRKYIESVYENMGGGLSKALKDIPSILEAQMDENGLVDLPVIVHYPVHRAILEIPVRVRSKKHKFDQLSAYDGALGTGSGFRTFFEWFREREDLENELRLDEPEYRDRMLEAVRRAIAGMMPGFDRLRVRRSPLRMTLTKDGQEILVNQLSDGEKCFLALVGDLARRLALANVKRNDPLQGEGIALIDEVDLHLHPSWQRRVVPGLLETFPNMQFIVSTHSPQVVSQVEPEGVWVLTQDPEKGLQVNQPTRSYGMDSNSVLETIMDVSERPELVRAALSEIFLQISEGDLEQAQQSVTALMAKIGEDPELAKANAMILRKQLVGK